MKCILCDKWWYWDIFVVKMPEDVALCMNCAEKYPDENTYRWNNEWWAIYKNWKWQLFWDIFNKFTQDK